MSTSVLPPEQILAADSTADDIASGSATIATGTSLSNGSLLSPRFEKALAFAAQLHAEQKRKGTEIPYVAHLLAVAGLTLEFGADEDEAIAALLHDAIEDQGGIPTEERIIREFGDNVAAIVRGCTDADTIPKKPWSKRKQIYITHLESATESVRLVSCCDKTHNAQAILRDYQEIGDALWSRFKGGKGGTLWYYGNLTDAFLRIGPPAPARELDAVVRLLEEATGLRRGEAVIPEGI